MPSSHSYGTIYGSRRQDISNGPPFAPDASSPSSSSQSSTLVSFPPQEVESPRNWSFIRKWSIVIVIAVLDLTVSWGASAYSPAMMQMETLFGVSEEVGLLGLSLYIIGLAFGPMTLAPLSEYIGRSPVYILSYGIYLLLILGTALVKNLGGFLFLRFFSGLFAVVTIANSGATIGDMFDSHEAGLAMSIFIWAATVGTPSGYFLFSFVAARGGLRYVFWVLLGICGSCWILMILILRETRYPVIVARRHKAFTGRSISHLSRTEQTKKTMHELAEKEFRRPFLFLRTEPIVILSALYNGYLFGLSFLFNSAFDIVLGTKDRGFGTTDVGLTFLGICVGISVGPITTALFQQPYEQKKLSENNYKNSPEGRVMLGKVAGVILPISLFWLAFTTYDDIHWIVPILATTLWGWCFYTLILMTYTYTEDSYKTYSASALIGICLVRYVVGASFPLFGMQMYHRIGNETSTALLAALSVLMIPIPFLFSSHGRRLREKSQWAKQHIETETIGASVKTQLDMRKTGNMV